MRIRSVLTLVCFLFAASFVSAAANCTISTDNPDPTAFTAVENVSTQGHYGGGPLYALTCSTNWYYANGNVSFRYVSPNGHGGHVAAPDGTTSPDEERFGRAITCTSRTAS